MSSLLFGRKCIKCRYDDKIYQIWYNQQDAMEFEIEDYQCSNGRRYVREFLAELKVKNPNLWAKTVAQIGKMKNKYYHKYPHSESLSGGLFEIRTKVGTDISRVFYCFGKGQTIYLLRGFVKKDQKIPVTEIEKARKLLKEFKKEEEEYEKN